MVTGMTVLGKIIKIRDAAEEPGKNLGYDY